MATYNGNNEYLSMNGTVIADPNSANDSVFRKMEMKLTTADTDTSGGSGQEWESHDGGLSVINTNIEINYDTALIGTHLDAVLNSVGRGTVIPIISGPEGNATGKPKHDQDFLITGVDGPHVNHDKQRVFLNITGISKRAPRSNLYAGDTF